MAVTKGLPNQGFKHKDTKKSSLLSKETLRDPRVDARWLPRRFSCGTCKYTYIYIYKPAHTLTHTPAVPVRQAKTFWAGPLAGQINQIY